ncbi:MAG: hypothetical protein DRI89_02670 [Bacteroidetes bacterium]|nr:MAG: hypothetical protein DRI89_02670 [Bacteroidota bacterium]
MKKYSPILLFHTTRNWRTNVSWRANANWRANISRALLSLLLLAALTTCKKEPAAPSGGNKIEIGQTNIDSIAYFTAKVSSALESTGGNEIPQHGFCWNTEKDPTTKDDKTTLGKLDKPVTFSSEITDLENNTTYHIRSYITYNYGTVYGTEQSVQTLKTGTPEVDSVQISNVTINSAHFISEVLADSGLNVNIRGFCWDTDSVFTIDDCLDSTVVGDGLGIFNSEVSGLNEGVDYFVKSYAINEKGISYGEVKHFSTIPITVPEVSTTEISEITINSAKSGGNVSSNGNGTVTARGVVWGINENPTVENNTGLTTDGSGTGVFTSSLTILQDDFTYYVRAYVTNEKGTSYGEAKQFFTLTLSLPDLMTATPSEITHNSAKSGGSILFDGNGTVTALGVCWNTNGNPTLENNFGFTNDGSGTGSFTSIITGLTENTTYFVAAYAINQKGTAYGEVEDFITEDLPCGELTIDYGGQIYHTVQIGNQCWMKENLNIGIRIDGSEDMLDNQVIEKYCYYNNEANCDVYGGLYQWDEMMQYTLMESAQGICPDGWHVPNHDEWTVLTDFLGGTNVAGGKMKETGTTHWNPPNTGATNSSGFTGLPGGNGNLQWFSEWGEFGFYWKSTGGVGEDAGKISLYYNNEGAYNGGDSKNRGKSVRCVKD